MLASLERKVILELLKWGKIEFSELCKRVRGADNLVSMILRSLPGVEISDGEVTVLNRLQLAIEGARRGIQTKILAQYIDWRDFERLSAKILSHHNYVVETNILMTRPVRLEIDVLGVDPGPGRAIVIDCKHWHHGLSYSMLYDIGRKHIDRVVRFLRNLSWISRKYPIVNKIKYAIPIIVTLTTPRLRCVDRRVLIVDISELNSLLQDIHLVIEELGVKPITLSEARGGSYF